MTAVILVALFLAMIANRLMEFIVIPIFVKAKFDPWWQMPVSWVLGGCLSALCGVHLIAPLLALLPGNAVMVPPLADLILTAIIVGGGANFINDVISSAPTAIVPAPSPPAPVKQSLADVILAREAARKQ